MGKPTLAGELLLVLRQEKQVKKKRERRKRSENLFFKYVSEKG